jgi:hypothetical protein
MIQLLIIVVCAILWRVGGSVWKMARHLVPAVLGLYFAIYFGLWWMFLVVGGLGQIVSIGYGIPDSTDPGSWLGRIITKIVGPTNAGWVTRGVAGILYALCIGFGPFILSGGSAGWIFPALFFSLYAVYVVFNFIVGGLCSYLKVKDFIIEPLIGMAIASLVLFI